MEAEQKYYKNFEANLFEVKGSGGWFISADNKEDALGLANKRGNYSEDDIIQVGTCATIFGTSDKYEDVINIREKLLSLSEVAPKQEQEELDFYCFDKNYHMIEKCKYQCAECEQRAKKFTPPIS